MKADHGLSHGLASGVEIEAAPEAAALVKKIRQPGGIGSGTRRGQTAVLGMEYVTTDGVDGRFAENDVRSREGGNGEEAEIFTGARGHAAPGNGTGAAQFGADGLSVGVAQKEDGVGFGVGVEVAGLSQGLHEGARQEALLNEVAHEGVELVRRGLWQAQFGAAQELPADALACLNIQRGGQEHRDIHEQTAGAPLEANHLHFHFVFSLHKSETL